MSRKLLHGFAWYTYPDVFGLDETDQTADPGHPFANGTGEIHPPDEVIYYRPANPADTGVINEKRAHSYLVMTKTQLHPKLHRSWEAEPADLTEGFKTQDGKVRMIRHVQKHHRHSGDLLECEISVE